MKGLNTKRKKFCRLIAEGESGAGAYRKAYKNKNSNTCKRNAHRLLQQPAVMIFLSFTPPPPVEKEEKEDDFPFVIHTIAGKQKRARRERAEREAEEARKKGDIYGYSLDEEMTATECKIILSRIARGTVSAPKYIVVNKELVEKPVPPSFAQRRSCIAELNKMRGIYQKPLMDDSDVVEEIHLHPASSLKNPHNA